MGADDRREGIPPFSVGDSRRPRDPLDSWPPKSRQRYPRIIVVPVWRGGSGSVLPGALCLLNASFALTASPAIWYFFLDYIVCSCLWLFGIIFAFIAAALLLMELSVDGIAIAFVGGALTLPLGLLCISAAYIAYRKMSAEADRLRYGSLG